MDTLSPHAQENNLYKVYEWVDPLDMSVFYIGITANLYMRFRQHMRCDGTNPQKDQRIQAILAAGHLPIVRTIEQVKTFEKALQREQYWIHHYQSAGMKLTNAQVQQERPVQKSRQMPTIQQDTWKPAARRRNTSDGIRQLFDLYWNERKPRQTFGDFFKDDLSDDMCADGWGYYPRHYISEKGKSHAQYKQWRREWLSKCKERAPVGEPKNSVEAV